MWIFLSHIPYALMWCKSPFKLHQNFILARILGIRSFFFSSCGGESNCILFGDFKCFLLPSLCVICGDGHLSLITKYMPTFVWTYVIKVSVLYLHLLLKWKSWLFLDILITAIHECLHWIVVYYHRFILKFLFNF